MEDTHNKEWKPKEYTLSEAEDFVYEKGQRYAREVKSESEYFSQQDEDKAIDHIAETQKFIAVEELDQIRLDAVLDWIVKDTKQKEHSYQLGLQKGRLEAKKELLDEIIELIKEDEKRALRNNYLDVVHYTGGLVEELKLRAKTLGEQVKKE